MRPARIRTSTGVPPTSRGQGRTERISKSFMHPIQHHLPARTALASARAGVATLGPMSTGETPTTWVMHVDLDQFLAAVEVRRRPELAGLPVVVGGDGNPRRPRQVVATASYEARAFGVRSGMPLAQALRRCPDAVFLPSDRPAYDAASAEVMATLRTFPATVEVWGWDEAFLGVVTDDPEALRARDQGRGSRPRPACRARSESATRDCSPRRQPGFAKPGGVARLTRREWIPTMGAKPVTEIWGIGARTAARLGELGIVTVEDLARADHRRARPQLRPDDRSAPANSRTRRRRLADRRRAAHRPRSQQGGDVHHRRHRRNGGRGPRRTTGSRRHGRRRRRRPTNHTRRGQGAHVDASSRAPRSASCRRRRPIPTMSRRWR